MDLLLPASEQINAHLFNLTRNDTRTLNGTQMDELFEGYSPGLLKFASIVCIVFVLIGIPGNLITILALIRCKKVRNATTMFIINLSTSDLLFCCFNLPLQASTFWFRRWVHSDLLCRIFPVLRYGLVAVSLFSILSITINRYIMISHPRLYPRIYRHKFLAIMIALTWIFPFSCLIRTWQGEWGKFGLDRGIGSCSILPDSQNQSPKEFLFILAFALPCISIVICYARIFYIVRKTAIRAQEPNYAKATTTSNNNLLQLKSQAKSLSNKLNQSNSDTQKESDSKESSSTVIQTEINGTTPNPAGNNYARHYLAKNIHDDLKFIDTSVDSDLPPSLSSDNLYDSNPCVPMIKNPSGTAIDGDGDTGNNFYNNSSNIKINIETSSLLSTGKKNLANSTNSINKNVEFSNIMENGTSRLDVDNISNHRNLSQSSILSDERTDDSLYDDFVNNNNKLNPAQNTNISISSGIDLVEDNAKRRGTFRKSPMKRTFRMKRTNKDGSDVLRKLSTAASAASILYPGRMSTKDRRLLKMILVIFISFLICYLPITITKLIKDVSHIHVLNIAGYLLIYLTTCINPIIYVVMSSEYRQAYRNLILCRGTTGKGGSS